jgi:hypothetical protein
MGDILSTIKRYSNGILNDEFHRYKSWEVCNDAFNVNPQTDAHTLHLAFYLASWGMYRGSSGLLQKNHLIHEETVRQVLDNTQHLNCNFKKEISREQITEILHFKELLSGMYSKINYTRGSAAEKPITPTDTLISKIMLGTLACVPAYDRYFIDGLRAIGLKNFTFGGNSLKELFDFVEANKKEIEECQQYMLTNTKKHYSIMKIVDMYFWQIGYEKEITDKSKQ